MRNESFSCENCKKEVEKDTTWWVRNHCPYCLFSKHLDEKFPWDRLSECWGMMEVVGIDYKKNKWWMIEHGCKICSKKILNKVAEDDMFTEWIKKKNTLTNTYL